MRIFQKQITGVFFSEDSLFFKSIQTADLPVRLFFFTKLADIVGLIKHSPNLDDNY